jgi:hypothetical protein
MDYKSRHINFLKKIIRYGSFGYERYSLQVARNYINQLFQPKTEHIFLFILSPPYNGSTLLHELISTSAKVSFNNSFGTREGQTLPHVREIMFDHQYRWDQSVKFDWHRIKREWMKYWDLRCPVLIEKSPPNMLRAKEIEKVFEPSYFIIFHRNPYAYCESAIRRERQQPQTAAQFAIDCLKTQKENVNALSHTLSLSYEQITSDTAMAIDSIRKFIPQLNDIEIKSKFNAHNYHAESQQIRNNNDIKISKISKTHLQEINFIFKPEEALLNSFGYQILD